MGLISKIFSGIKKVVKGVVKGVKKVVKGVAKVVKKVAKSKIFKAILIAAAVYYTGGAFLHGAGVSGPGMFGTWAGNVGNVMATSGTFLSTVTKPFTALGYGLGQGARAVTDWAGMTDPLGAEAITGAGTGVEAAAGETFTKQASTYIDPLTGKTMENTIYIDKATGKAVTGEWWKERAASAAASQGVGPTAVAAGQGDRSKFVQGLGTWAGKVAGSVTSGYILNELQGEDPAGAMFAGDIEGKRYFDPLTIYGMDGRPLDINSAYENLLYGNIDPFAAKNPLYTQATV